MGKKKTEIVEEEIDNTHNSNQKVEPVNDTEEDNSIQKTKPKKRVQSEKQKAAFAKLIEANKKRFEERQIAKEQGKEPAKHGRPKKEKEKVVPVATPEPVVEESSSEEEAPAPVVKKKKKKKKQKIVIEDDSSSSENEIIIRRSRSKKKKEPVVEDKQIEKTKPIPIPQETPKEVEEPVAKKYTHKELLKAFGL